MKVTAVIALLLAACSFDHGALPDDGGVDGRLPDGPPGCVSFSSQLDTCTMTGMDDLLLSGTSSFDTSTGALLAGATPVTVHAMQITGKAGPIEILVVHDLHLMASARLRVTGTVPFGVIAYGTITIDGGAVIDASAGGAGARASCSGGAIVGVLNNGGAGGGGGGGFGAMGGEGGTGNGDGTHAAGGTGGLAATKPQGPLAGCPGAKGGEGSDPGGNGGAAGGAVYLAAHTLITIAASGGINAGGGGGQGGQKSGVNYGDAGGGGGGSGGMILLESAKVRVFGTVAANGGSGGEASGNGSSGVTGATGLLAVDPALCPQGNSSSGTDGGAGGAFASPTGGTQSMIDNGGGGGGGGGVGFIVVVSPDQMLVTASPAAS